MSEKRGVSRVRGSGRAAPGLWSLLLCWCSPAPLCLPGHTEGARAEGHLAGNGMSNTTGFGLGTAACEEGTALSFPRETASLLVMVCAQNEGKYVPQRGGEDTQHARCFRGLPQGPGSGA